MNIMDKCKELFGVSNARSMDFDECHFTDEKYANVVINYELDDKVDRFIKWYTDNVMKNGYCMLKATAIKKANRMRNFIEKAAIWYELRYPCYEVNRMMPGSSQEDKEVSKIMFQDNEYVNILLDDTSEISELDWDEFYNTNVFINSLPMDERFYFMDAGYPRTVYLNSYLRFHLSSYGIVLSVDDWDGELEAVVSVSDILGRDVKDVVRILESKGMKLPEDSDVKKAIRQYDDWNYQKDEMLNCIMYRIIERGGNRIGPRRGFLFAKEFGRNIDIPMAYGVDTSDPGLKGFIDEYLKAGGDENLTCLDGYFWRNRQNEPLLTISLKKILLLKPVGYDEKEIYQRLVDVLSTHIEQEAKQLRLEKNRRR